MSEGKKLLGLLERIAQTEIAEYRPDEVISAINALIRLGKEGSLRAIQDCLSKLTPNQETVGLFWILRILFDLPSGRPFPPVSLGNPDIPPPSQVELLPRYPIVLVQDVPFLVVSGYMLAGLPETVDSHLVFFQSYGIIRPQPLRIPSDLASVLEEFEMIWRSIYGPRYMGQVLPRVKAQLAYIKGSA